MSRRNSTGKRSARSERKYKNSRRAANKSNLVSLLDWFLPDERIFAKLNFHGNTTWSQRHLVWLAICWAWSECRNLTDGFSEAAGCCEKIFGSSPLGTYQGFMKAMVKWTPSFIDILCVLLQERMEQIGSNRWRIDAWIPIAFDGSRSTAPRTKANEKALCAANYGSGKTARYRKKKSKGLRRKRNQRSKPQPQQPQAWITMLWHMGLRLPWTWRLGPSDSSERDHVREMLKTGTFPESTLFCGDAGFVGYPLWSEIRQLGAHFLVRVGANVTLLKESADYRFEKKKFVLCWPKAIQDKKQLPLRLRLVRVQLGKTWMWMLTSVLERTKLTDKQIINFYKMRWGIEVEFRGLKQTLNRSRLRSRNDARLLAELNWSIMAMAIAELFALKEQLKEQESKRCSRSIKDPPPLNASKRSLANTMRALRFCLRNLDEVPPPNRDLQNLLRDAVTDCYQRKGSKGARYRPSNPDKKPLGDPTIRLVTRDETKKLRDLEAKLAA